MKIVGIDVGYTNLALVVAHVDEEDNEIEVTYAKMTNLAHVKCVDPSCIFHKDDKSPAHKCHHFVESMDEYLRDSDVVLMERQPLQGLTGVEQSIYIYIKQRYSAGDQAHMRLISPNAMHKHFAMSSEKVERRVEIVEIARRYLEHNKNFKMAREKDHLCDAMGFIIFYVHTMKKITENNPFASFKYTTTT